MKDDKILTIAIPTYNRSRFLKNSLKRISSQIKDFENEIELLISDNCSSDNTQEIVDHFIESGVILKYNRNRVNLGMDGNFLYCLKNATAKYLWILGDDDYLTDGAIAKLMNVLKFGDYGLIHLDNKKIDNFQTKSYTNKSDFFKDISFMITFISANIVQTKYISQIDLNKYLGTYFIFIPAYMTSLIGEKNNLIVYSGIIEDPADASTNGGYNIFSVFVTNYLDIIKEFRSSLGYKYYEIEKYKLCRLFIYPWMIKLLTNSQHGLQFKTDDWFKIIFKKYWYEPYFYPMLFLLLKKIRITHE